LHDDVTLHGSADALIAMDHVLLSTVEILGLLRARHKCAVYAPDFETRTHVASALDLPEARDAVVVAGSPLGKSDFVASFAQERTEAVEDLVDKFAELSLRRQDRILLLRESWSALPRWERTESRWTKVCPSQRSPFRWWRTPSLAQPYC
jgi:hypothetical protein